jgi:molybdopterin-binding protein
MKLSARNRISGKVVNIVRGGVNAEVTVELSGGEQLVSVVTVSSVDAMGLRVEAPVLAIVKASNVMLGTDD